MKLIYYIKYECQKYGPFVVISSENGHYRFVKDEEATKQSQ